MASVAFRISNQGLSRISLGSAIASLMAMPAWQTVLYGPLAVIAVSGAVFLFSSLALRRSALGILTGAVLGVVLIAVVMWMAGLGSYWVLAAHAVLGASLAQVSRTVVSSKPV